MREMVLASIASAVLCSCSQPEIREDPKEALAKMYSASQEPKDTGDATLDALNRQYWSNSWLAYSVFMPHVSGYDKLLDPLPGEESLYSIGEAAVVPATKILISEKLDVILCSRLLVFIGRFGDGAVRQVLEGYVASQQPPFVRRAAVRGLGLLDSQIDGQFLATAESARLAPSQDFLWARLMHGDNAATREYWNWIEMRIASHLDSDERPYPQIVRPDPSGVLGGDNRKAESVSAKNELLGDLINLSDVKDTKAIGLLIECLRHEDVDVQHLAERLLRQRVRSTVGRTSKEIVEGTCRSLHDRGEYRAWKTWFDVRKSALHWSKSRFVWTLVDEI